MTPNLGSLSSVQSGLRGPSGALDTGPFARAERTTGLRDAQRSFSSVIARANASASADPAAQAREAAEQFVSVALVEPLLAQVRESNNAAEPFRPTQGEKQFRALLDAQTAQGIVHASSFPLVERLAQDLLRAAGRTSVAPPVGEGGAS